MTPALGLRRSGAVEARGARPCPCRPSSRSGRSWRSHGRGTCGSPPRRPAAPRTRAPPGGSSTPGSCVFGACCPAPTASWGGTSQLPIAAVGVASASPARPPAGSADRASVAGRAARRVDDGRGRQRLRAAAAEDLAGEPGQDNPAGGRRARRDAARSAGLAAGAAARTASATLSGVETYPAGRGPRSAAPREASVAANPGVARG